MLRQGGEDAKLLAGGQSLGPLLNLRLARPAVVIDLNRIGGLAYIRKESSVLVVGAMTRQRELEFSTLLIEEFPIVGEAIRQLGHPAIRNRGTIGGSLAHADPAAELPCVLSALDARIVATGPEGERICALDVFLQGPYATDLSEDEILTEIQIPLEPRPESWAFLEFSRRHGDFALAEVAVVLYSAGSAYDQARVVVGTPSTAPMRLELTSREIVGLGIPVGSRDLAADLLVRIQTTAAREIAELAGSDTLTAYEEHLAAVLVRRAVAQAVSRRSRV
jgi:carbon-monoxide dehydrogenase medium subunit